MQLPTIDRTPNLRPVGAETASSGANRVIPIAPVNPSVTASPSVEPTPGVVDMVNPALKTNDAANNTEQGYTTLPDPAQHGSKAANAPKDWTIHRPAPEKVEDPPLKPLYQVLMEHIKSMWTASANAVQLDQVHNQLTQPQPVSPTEAPGDLAKQILVYDPSTIKKTENI
jgi:hypothetical protein